MTETNKIQGLFPFSIPAIYCCSQLFLEANMCVCFVHCFTPILIDVSISPCRNLLKSMRPYLTLSICCSTQKWDRRKQSCRWQWNEWRNWPCDIKKKTLKTKGSIDVIKSEIPSVLLKFQTLLHLLLTWLNYLHDDHWNFFTLKNFFPGRTLS